MSGWACEYERRWFACRRSEAYRDRKHRGAMVVSVEIEVSTIAL
jgi:hypothetical protein